MSSIRPRGHNAVMSSNSEAPDSLNFFPTPPFATRALCENVLRFNYSSRNALRRMTAWEPAAGEGHMAEPLREYFGNVWTSDVHDYGKGYAVGSFVGDGPDRLLIGAQPDWVITNPPFQLALEFAERGLTEAQHGVALLLRSVFIESAERFKFFQKHPLSIVAPFAERVAMTKGRWDPKATTATSYAWFIWIKGFVGPTQLHIIPPGRKLFLTAPDDVDRFGWKPPKPQCGELIAEPELVHAVTAFGEE